MTTIRLWPVTAVLLLQTAHSVAATITPQALLGAWQLISVETVGPKGEISYPFYGRKPQGLLIYDASGWMSIQVVSDPKPMVPVDDTRAGFIGSPEAERAAAADGYYAYLGTFKVDIGHATVTHYIQESLYPGERGQIVTRRYLIADGRLTLISTFREMGEEHQRRLTWIRAPTPRQ